MFIMDVIQDLSFAINKAGIDFIHALQKRYPRSGDCFQTVTEIANPLYAFTLLFPVFSVFSPKLATKLLTTAMLSEWTNALLKWLLMGHRPFWWVREYLEEAQPLRTPKLKQTPFTCETGPGNPSGHVMSYASIVFILLSAAIPLIIKNRPSRVQNWIKFITWGIYGVSILLVSVSRLYVAAHFPHQCFLGALIGIGLGYFVEKTSSEWMRQWSRRKLLKAVAVMLGAAFGGYWLQRLVGVDPQWSVKLAFKWCETPDHVHVSTTPIFALTRDCGTALGLAFAIPSMMGKYKASSRVDLVVTHLLQSVGAIGVLWAANKGKQSVPTSDARLYYLCIMLLNAALPFLLLVFVPKLTHFIGKKIFGKAEKKKKQ